MRAITGGRQWQALVLIAAMLLTACSANNGEPSEDAPAIEAPEATADEAADGAAGDEQASHPAPTEPIAALPDYGIALYPLGEEGVSEEGVELVIGEQRQRLDWRYTTPRQIMPAMQAADYDGDGKDELAVVLNIGSGTGVSVDELHVVEFQDVNGTSDAPFVDYMLPEADYRTQLEEALAFRVNGQDGGWIGEIAIDGQRHEISLNEFLSSYGVEPEAIADRLGFGSIVYFDVGQGEITFAAAVGLVVDGIAEPQYIGRIEADVTYGPGTFTLGHYRFTPEM